MTCLELVMKYGKTKRMAPDTAEGVVYQRLVQLMEEGDFDLVTATEEDWKKLLTNNQSLKPSYRRRARSMLRLLLLWLERQEVDCADSLEHLMSLDFGAEADWSFDSACFFPSLDGLLDAIDQMTINRLGSYGKWQPLITLMILLWHGVSLEDALQVRKTEVSYNGSVLFVKAHGQIVEMKNQRGNGIITAYAKAYGYEEASTGKYREYAPCPFLIRTGKGGISKEVAQVNFSNFTKLARELNLPYRFLPSCIYLNGGFCDALEETKKNHIPIEPVLPREYASSFARWLREPTLQSGTVSLKDHYETFCQWKAFYGL